MAGFTLGDLQPPPNIEEFDFKWREWLWYLYQQVQDNVSRDFFFDVSAGRINGHSGVNKFGRNPAIAADKTETIWDGSTDGNYPFPATATITHIRSAVDSAITQGVVVEVQGLDTNWELVVQNVTTDGADSTTEVALGTALRRVFRMKVLDAETMDQDLWVGPDPMATAAAALGIVTAGNNQTLMAVYTVPANKTAYMISHYATLNPVTNQDPSTMQIDMWVQDNVNGYAPQLKHTMGLDADGGTILVHEFKPYMKITEKSDMFMNGTTANKAADISAGFDLILVDNT